jgi:hypothetical protein
MKSIIAACCLISIGITSAYAQRTDSYADVTRKQMEFLSRRTSAVNIVKFNWQAQGCGVITENDAQKVASVLLKPFFSSKAGLDAYLNGEEEFNRSLEMFASAKREGLAEAKSEGCDFWTPFAVQEHRKIVARILAENR